MSQSAFILAVLVLLVVPGPTNTLLALGGASAGVVASWRLAVAALSGYFCAVLPLAWLGGPLVATWPVMGSLLQAAAAVWVLLLAVRLWSPANVGQGTGTVTWAQVWVTTALNPKSLVVALALLPAAGDPAFWPRLALFALLVLVASGAWLLAGGAVRTGVGSERRMIAVQRFASLWLAAVSFGLLARALSA